jgi:NUMOD4 motif/HNH endonuclease
VNEPTWLPVTGFEGYYEVSRFGLVRSVTRKGVGRRGVRGRILKPFPDDAGYLKVNLAKDGKTVTRRVHQLVMESFAEPCPPGMEVRHYPDPDKSNNALTNLSYGTKSRNTLDQVEHGTHKEARKERCPTCSGPYSVHQRGKTKGKRYCPACGNANRRARSQPAG